MRGTHGILLYRIPWVTNKAVFANYICYQIPNAAQRISVWNQSRPWKLYEKAGVVERLTPITGI